MACRVGMSRNPRSRIKKWMKDEGHTYWEILHESLTYDQALRFEKLEAAKRGCRQEEGGPRDETSDWAVYYVSGGTIKKAARSA